MAPSETNAILAACSGVDMPKPTAHGTEAFSRTSLTSEGISVFISLRTPVTPRLDTIYMNPCALLAIMAIRFAEVGAMSETRSTPYFSQMSSNSSFSSNGRSGRIPPSIPISELKLINYSAP